jgi:hypothetical protein
MEVCGKLHVPAALYPREQPSLYPLDRRLGRHQSRESNFEFSVVKSVVFHVQTDLLKLVLLIVSFVVQILFSAKNLGQSIALVVMY